ncbi:ferrous iron transporter B [Cellulomonas sp. SLBN-39]|uniref:ferrous iron transporter B n=1 Tax=Cellulomonas sp. SLBN-39 TaxID=2768446 RepID=UPI00114E79AE|nr:ferrous iron transporter B [Cellulomonas sp. SLBN-39]TQL01740.1 ferrous iron transport protein B [Cellulomonas sp. SLBN-39]
MSCHEPGGPAPTGSATPTGAVATLDEPLVVLVGCPNVGKSSLFNTVTGGRQRVVNAPGTTVELEVGSWRGVAPGGRAAQVVDLPGTYSLLARTPDEEVAAAAVTGAQGLRRPDLVVVLLEAGALARSLSLYAQVVARGVPVVAALTLVDVAADRGVVADVEVLAARLGVPVVPVHPRSGRGVEALRDVVAARLASAAAPRPVAGDREARGPVPDGPPRDPDDVEALFAWVDDVTHAVAGPPPEPVLTWSDRADRVLLHPAAGVPVLLAVLWALFQLSTAAAAPLMDAVDVLVGQGLAPAVTWLLGVAHAPAWVTGLLVDGVLAGVGTVLTFVPLMALMFVAVALLEDSGYLARAAFVADRAMRAIGLDGRAVLPFVVGFGCNLPALAATRTLPHARQRLLVGMLVPWTSCPARLTVYVLMGSVFFPGRAGTAVFVMYLASVLLVVLGGLVMRRTAFRDLRREPLVLALPAYQRPRARAIAAAAWARVRSFVTRAGRVVVVTLTAMWLLLAVPVAGGHAFGDVPVEDSAYGRVSAAMAPAFAPAGFGDWHAAAALVTGFVAKEVVVGSFAQSYAVAEPADPAHPGDLGAQLRATLERTSGGHPGAAAAAFMVFTLAYTPCLATVAEQRRLFGLRWTLGGVGVQLAVAWVLAVVVFQVGALL